MKKPQYKKKSNQLTKKDNADALSSKIRQSLSVLQDILNIKMQEYLYTDSDKPKNIWFRSQNINNNAFKLQIRNVVSTEFKNLKKDIKSSLVSIDMKEKQVKKIIDDVEKQCYTIGNLFFMLKNKTVSQIKVSNADFTRVDALHEEIKNVVQSQKAFANQLVPMKDRNGNVRTKADGTPMMEHWESKIERQVRTKIHSQIGKDLVNTGNENQQVFYICNSFGDSRKEHSDLQARVYVAKNYKSFISNDEVLKQVEAYISANDIKTVEWAMSEDVGLSTWCNCRHYFDYISIDEVLAIRSEKDKNNVLQERDMFFNGKYEESKNNALNKQRYYERGIKEWKRKRDEAELNLATLPKDASDEVRLKALKDVVYTRNKVSDWQKQQRYLFEDKHMIYDKSSRQFIDAPVKLDGVKGENLSRDYKRENPNDIYNLGNKVKIKKTTLPSTSKLKKEIEELDG